MLICPTCSQVEESTGPSSRSPCSSKTTDARCNACTALAELDAKFAEALLNMQALQAQRLQILSDVNHEHDLLRKRFPVEIVSTIFRQCCPDLETVIKGDDRMLTSVPLRLSAVCRGWRAIAHAIPSLWNIMALDVKESQLLSRSFQGILEVAQEWIGHSGDFLPLHVVVKVEPELKAGLRETRRDLSIFKATTDHDHRLAYLHVEGSNKAVFYLQALGENLAPPSGLHQLSTPSFIIYPSTEYTSLSGNPFHPTTLRPKRMLLENNGVSLKNLTHVNTSFIQLEDVITLLRYAPNLLSFKSKAVDFLPDEMEPSLPSSPLAHQILEEFHVTASEGMLLAPCIFPGFNFPSLKSLTLSDDSEPGEAEWRALFLLLADHIRRSGCHLQSISFDNLVLDFDSSGNYSWFTEFFELTGCSLNHLDVRAEDVRSGDYRLASVIGSMLGHLPNLCSIKLYGDNLLWIHVLKNLLFASTATTIPNGQQLSITIWSYESLLDNKTGNIDPRALSYHVDECRLLEATDIQMILDIMNHNLISVTIAEVDLGYDHLGESIATDITAKVIIDLGRALRQKKAKRVASEKKRPVWR